MLSQENTGGCSFSIIVMRRILDVLSDVDKLKKTNLAGKTGLNYPNCLRYIELMQLFGWVRTSTDGTFSVSITGQGRYFKNLLSGVLNGTNNLGNAKESLLFKSISKIPSTLEVLSSVDDQKLRLNVMIVDDEEDVLLTYKMYLSQQGFNVQAFQDAKEALQNFAAMGASYYDLVITDIRMKNLNGLQLYHGIKCIDPNVKVMFVTALDAIEEMISMLPDVTEKNVIRKPIGPLEFVTIVKEAISEAKSVNLRPLISNKS